MSKLTIKQLIENLTWFNLVELLKEILSGFNKKIEFLEGNSSGGGSGGISEAPIDGTQYGRQDGEWTEISGGSGGNQDLQSVLTNGSFTTGGLNIFLTDDSNAGALISPSLIQMIDDINGQTNSTFTTYRSYRAQVGNNNSNFSEIFGDKIQLSKTNEEGNISNLVNFVVNPDVTIDQELILQAPLGSGTKTLATIEDLTLQKAIDGGNVTNSDIWMLPSGHYTLVRDESGSDLKSYGTFKVDPVNENTSRSILSLGIGITNTDTIKSDIVSNPNSTNNTEFQLPIGDGIIKTLAVVEDITLQKTLNTGNSATYDSGNNQIGILKDFGMEGAGRKYVSIQTQTGNNIAQYDQRDNNITLNHQTLNSLADLTLSSGKFVLNQSDKFTGFSNTISFEDPTNQTTIRIPAPSIDGDYTFALKEEFMTMLSASRNVGLQNITFDGITSVYSIPHGLGQIPSYANANRAPGGVNFDDYTVSWDITNVILTYTNPPIGNASFNWIALK